ncbi:MAG: hypothetical protein HZB46_10995 [Solirubrobacterales bacterium]|nr:hypothetical protein [Solirubrobacterales bacterium]
MLAGPRPGRARRAALLAFRVTGGGREIRDFRVDVPMLCPGVVAGQFTTQIGRAAVRRIRIAPDGGFLATATSGGDTAILVRGRLARGRVTGGRAQLSVGTCSGTHSFTAARR